mmetsp:Transcript_22854/g.53464  ORF Transcript_22854/g.53464 Transcript_22854/m.53464 type:complete len:952 (+) Transcript_22854:157-3012(+)
MPGALHATLVNVPVPTWNQPEPVYVDYPPLLAGAPRTSTGQSDHAQFLLDQYRLWSAYQRQLQAQAFGQKLLGHERLQYQKSFLQAMQLQAEKRRLQQRAFQEHMLMQQMFAQYGRQLERKRYALAQLEHSDVARARTEDMLLANREQGRQQNFQNMVAAHNARFAQAMQSLRSRNQMLEWERLRASAAARQQAMQTFIAAGQRKQQLAELYAMRKNVGEEMLRRGREKLHTMELSDRARQLEFARQTDLQQRHFQARLQDIMSKAREAAWQHWQAASVARGRALDLEATASQGRNRLVLLQQERAKVRDFLHNAAAALQQERNLLQHQSLQERAMMHQMFAHYARQLERKQLALQQLENADAAHSRSENIAVSMREQGREWNYRHLIAAQNARFQKAMQMLQERSRMMEREHREASATAQQQAMQMYAVAGQRKQQTMALLMMRKQMLQERAMMQRIFAQYSKQLQAQQLALTQLQHDTASRHRAQNNAMGMQEQARQWLFRNTMAAQNARFTQAMQQLQMQGRVLDWEHKQVAAAARQRAEWMSAATGQRNRQVASLLGERKHLSEVMQMLLSRNRAMTAQYLQALAARRDEMLRMMYASGQSRQQYATLLAERRYLRSVMQQAAQELQQERTAMQKQLLLLQAYLVRRHPPLSVATPVSSLSMSSGSGGVQVQQPSNSGGGAGVRVGDLSIGGMSNPKGPMSQGAEAQAVANLVAGHGFPARDPMSGSSSLMVQQTLRRLEDLEDKLNKFNTRVPVSRAELDRQFALHEDAPWMSSSRRLPPADLRSVAPRPVDRDYYPISGETVSPEPYAVHHNPVHQVVTTEQLQAMLGRLSMGQMTATDLKTLEPGGGPQGLPVTIVHNPSPTPETSVATPFVPGEGSIPVPVAVSGMGGVSGATSLSQLQRVKAASMGPSAALAMCSDPGPWQRKRCGPRSRASLAAFLPVAVV